MPYFYLIDLDYIVSEKHFSILIFLLVFTPSKNVIFHFQLDTIPCHKGD